MSYITIKEPETISKIFDSFIASYQEEEPPRIEAEAIAEEELNKMLDGLRNVNAEKINNVLEAADKYAAAAAKTGFIIGFRMGFDLLTECRG